MSKKTKISRARSHAPKPRQLCELVQLYLHVKELSVVVSFISSGKKPIELNSRAYDSSELPELYLELDITLKAAEKLMTAISLPRWNDLDAVGKQALRVAYLGTLPDAAFITINLDTAFAGRGVKNKRGLARFVGEAIRKELRKLALAGCLALNLEEAHGRAKNSPFHAHLIALVPHHLWPSVTLALKERLSVGYIEHAGNKAVLIKSINTPGSLAGYVCKDMADCLPMNLRRSYSSQSLTSPVRALYSDVRNWCQSITVVRASLQPLLPARPSVEDKASPIQLLAAEKMRMIEERRRRSAAHRRARRAA